MISPNNKKRHKVQMRDAFSMLREKLRSFGCVHKKFSEAGIDIHTGNCECDLPPLEYAVRNDSQLNTLIKLFFIGMSVSRKQLMQIFSSDEIHALSAIGILSVQKRTVVTSHLKIFPYNEFLFLCDFVHHPRRKSYNLVYPPGFDSTFLASTIVPHEFNDVLDLCTGSGIQAIIAAQRSKQVIAVDVNPRALKIAALNAMLNDTSVIEFRRGNLYKPVSGETFDLILANPPFVISPEKSQQFRDGGSMGDDVLRKILDGIPHYLNKGGYCQVVTFLSEFEGFSHFDFLRQFASKHNFRTLILSSPSFNAIQLATGQFKRLLTRYRMYRQKVLQYLQHLEAIKFKKGTLSVIVFRNSADYAFKHQTIESNVTIKQDPLQSIKEFFN